MAHFKSRACAIVTLSLFLAACGGGGGGAAESVVAAESGVAAQPVIAASGTKLAALLPPPGSSFASFQTSNALRSTDLVFNASDFPDAARSYASIWYVDHDGSRQQVAFTTLQALRAMDAHGGITFQAPGYVKALAYEIYDNDSTTSGGLTL